MSSAAFNPDEWAAKQPAPQPAGEFDPDAWAQALSPDFKGTDQQLNEAGSSSRFPQLRENSDETIPQSVRARASFKGTQTGVFNYLRDKYGRDNVEPVYSAPRNILSPSGEHLPDPNYKPEVVNYRIQLAKPSKDAPGKVVLFDPKGLDLGDVTDFAGDAVETIPAAIGGAIGGAAGAVGGGTAGVAAGPPGAVIGAAAGGTKGALLGTAAGALVGSAARQAIGAMLPGDENMSAADRAVSAVANVAGSVVGEGVGRVGSKVISKALSPIEQIAGRQAAREVVEPIADQGLKEAADIALGRAPGAAEEVASKPFSMVSDEPPPIPLQSQDNAASAAGGINTGKLRGREAAASNLELAEETGIGFTPGQLTGGKEQIAFERMIAQIPGGQNIMHAGDVKRANQLAAYVNNTVKGTAGESVGADYAARAVAGARKQQMEHLSEMRSKAAQQGFGAAIRDGGDKNIVPINNTLRVIDEIQGEYGGAISTDSADAVTKKLAEIKRDLISALDTKAEITKPGNAYRSATTATVDVPGRAEDVRVSVRKLQNDLRNFGKQAAGSGKFIKDLDPGTDRALSARVFGALQQDLAAAADSTDPLLAKAAGGLKQSRDVYREMSKAMSDQDDLVFKRVTDLLDKSDAPEKLVTALAQGGDGGTFVPSQVRKTMATLIGTPENPGIDPVAGRSLRGAVLEKLIGGTRPNPNTGLGSAGVEISPKQFATMAQKNGARIEALFHGDPQGLVAWRKAAQAARMLGDDAGINGGSQTAPMQAVKGLFEAFTTLGPRAVTAPLETARGIVKETAAKANAKGLAEVFNNPEARNIYLGLADSKRSLTREQIIAGMTRIRAVIERDRRLFSGAPNEETQAPPQQGGTAIANHTQETP